MFWEVFSGSILAGLKAEQGGDARLSLFSQARQMLATNQADPFICKATYCLAVEYYKQGSFADAEQYCRKSLRLPETQFGNHLSAWNLIAESYKAMGNYRASIAASDQVIQGEGPDMMKYDLHQAALTRKADLLLQLTNVVDADRRAAERLLQPLTEIKNSGPFSDKRGQLIRARVDNLKELRDFSQAYEVGDDFIKSNPSDAFAPLIAADLCKLTNHYASLECLKSWVKFFSSGQATNSAALANLKLDLMNAYARRGEYKEATQIGRELADFKKEPNDPVPWGKNTLESVANVMEISQGQIVRDARLVGSPVAPEHKQPIRIVLLAFFALSCVILLAVVIKSKRNAKRH